MNSGDTLSFLSASAARSEVLLALDAEGEMGRDRLYDRLDASRRTVKRALSALDERGYLVGEKGTYRPTALGRTVADAHRAYVERTERAERLAPLLSRVDADDFDLDPAHLANAEVVVGDDAAPLAALDRFVELRGAATSVGLLAPTVQAKSIRQSAERTRNGDVAFEAVLPGDVLDAAREEYTEAHDAAMDADSFSAFRYDGDVPFMLATLDDTVALGVTENGVPHAIVVSENEAVREWAEATFRRFREAATSLT